MLLSGVMELDAVTLNRSEIFHFACWKKNFTFERFAVFVRQLLRRLCMADCL